MPTKTHKTGDKTWYDEVGELDEEEGPGYSDNKGCFGQAAMLVILILLII